VEAVAWRVRDALLLFVFGLVMLVASVAGAQWLYLLQGTPQDVPAHPPAALAALATLLVYLVMPLGVWLLIVRRYRTRWSVLGLRRPRRAALVPVLLLCALLIIGTALVVVATSSIPALFGARVPILPESGLPPRDAPLFPVAVLGTALLVPAVEELLFRGVLYQALRARGGVAVSVVWSALAFTLLHARSSIAPEFFLLGIVLALAFEQAHSLYPSIAIHAAYNGLILALAVHPV